MVFSSAVFLFLFLPAVLGFYFLAPNRFKNHVLLLSSLFFYAWGEKAFVLVMLATILANYVYGLLIDRLRGERRGKIVLGIAIATNLGFLIVFKYANFLTDNLNHLLSSFGSGAVHLAPVHLPIGISFFTFQAMSYVIDVARGDVPVQRNLLRMALYKSLFPQLIAGPIVRYREVAKDIGERIVTLSDFAAGVRRFIIGLGKKMLIANTLAGPADAIFNLSAGELTPGLAWLGIACYTLQLYFDFSGYSDMAIGLGRMFGFHFGENFNYPYVARSVTEFWRRWHISLSTWFRDYLYIPLGGNRGSAARTYFNLVLVFFLCGLWHGASWNFILWGLFHGVLLITERLGLSRLLAGRMTLLSHLYLMVAVMIGWVFFRATTILQSCSFIAAMFGRAHGDGIEQHAGRYMNTEIWLTLIIGVVGSMPFFPAARAAIARTSDRLPAAGTALRQFSAFAAVSFFGLILWLSALSLASGTHNPFIYFRF
jgi:alginate O-acetyltransferase complex protein AlgI